MTVLYVFITCAALALSADTLFALWLMLYAWDDPARLKERGGPAALAEPQLGFSALVPARDEATVIGETIARLCQADYSGSLPRSERFTFPAAVGCWRPDRATAHESFRTDIPLTSRIS